MLKRLKVDLVLDVCSDTAAKILLRLTIAGDVKVLSFSCPRNIIFSLITPVIIFLIISAISYQSKFF